MLDCYVTSNESQSHFFSHLWKDNIQSTVVRTKGDNEFKRILQTINTLLMKGYLFMAGPQGDIRSGEGVNLRGY